MEDDQLSQSDPPTEVDVSKFRNGQEPRDTDVFIAVMGVTGAGKSTLISHLASNDNKPKVGSGLKSCTQDVAVFTFPYSPTTNVYLIDTPGFDDTFVSDKDILKSIAAWLGGMYSSHVRLHGILYLHRIVDKKMTGHAVKNLTMFRTLCGPDALQKVILVTTFWEEVSENIGSAREQELRTTTRFWKPLLARGSRMERHTNDRESALRLINLIIENASPSDQADKPLAIQRAMVDGKANLDDTEAAKEVISIIRTKERQLIQDRDDARAELGIIRGQPDLEADQHNLVGELEAEVFEVSEVRKQTEIELNISLETLLIEKLDQVFDEPEVDKDKRLEMQYGVRHPSTENRPSFTSSQLMALHFQRLSKDRTREESNSWFNRTIKTYSLSLRGRHCAFLGPLYSKSYLPQSTCNSLVSLERSANVQIKRIVLGEGSSYFAHYHQGIFFKRCYYRGAVKSNYPGLWDFLCRDQNTYCPESISLGPMGSYFINVAGKKSFKCHPNALIDTDAQSANRLWWGFDGSYVIEMNMGSESTLKWDLRGHYGDLDRILDQMQVMTMKIKELALNIEDGGSFALTTKDGSVFHDGDDDIVSSNFSKFAERHFRKLWRDGGGTIFDGLANSSLE